MLVVAPLFTQPATLNVVEKNLRRELSPLSGVQFSHNGDTLIIKYRTEIVNEPVNGKAAQKMVERKPTEHPAPTGFQLQTYEYPHKQTDPMRVMQAVKTNADWLRDYGSWKADARDRQLKGADKARYYYLAWGSKTNTKLIHRIRLILDKDTHG